MITHLSGVSELKFLCNIKFFFNGIYRTCFTLYAYFGLGSDPTIKLLSAQLQQNQS